MAMERSISKKLYTLFLIVFLVIFLWLLVNILVHGDRYQLLYIIAMFLISGILLLIFMKLRKRIDSISEGKFRLLMLSLFLIFTALLMVTGYLLTQVLVLDLKVVYESIPDLLDNMVMDRYSHYYVVCNNNVGLLLLLGGFFRVMKIFGVSVTDDAGLTAAICFNAFMIMLSVAFLVLTAKRIYERKSTVLLVFLVCAFCPVFYLFTPVFYTDTLSSPFVTATIYIYILARGSKTFTKRMLLLLLATLTAFLGFALKGSVGVLVVAIVIHLFIDRRDSILRTISASLCVVSLFSLMYLSYRYWQRNSGFIDFSREEEVGLPFGLWFLYGSHLPGYYSEEDLQYCISFEGLEARREAVNAKIWENYRSYTFTEYVSMATEKAVMTWSDGKYDADVFLCTPYRVNFTHHIILAGQPLYMPYTIYANGYHLMSLVLLCYGMFGRIRKKGTAELDIVYITIFGVMLFFNFWETTPRYLLNILPLICLVAADGIRDVSELSGRKQKKT